MQLGLFASYLDEGTQRAVDRMRVRSDLGHVWFKEDNISPLLVAFVVLPLTPPRMSYSGSIFASSGLLAST